MAAADIFLLPSHREGFGATVIEAAACGIPTIGTSIYGLTDAVADGQSGILVPVGQVAALTDAIVRLTADSELRRKMGVCARQRVECCFTEAHLTTAFRGYYEQFLGAGPAAS
jgi:glycosyltransferase involved in cell wall biosynthesis